MKYLLRFITFLCILEAYVFVHLLVGLWDPIFIYEMRDDCKSEIKDIWYSIFDR